MVLARFITGDAVDIPELISCRSYRARFRTVIE